MAGVSRPVQTVHRRAGREPDIDNNNTIKEQYLLRSEADLREHYRQPSEGVVLKTIDRLDDYCCRLIAASPFAVLATGATTGLDCSPKGDAPGFIQVLDDRTLLIPDRPGNNRIDGLTNIVQDPRVGLIFLLPGVYEALRINGRACISVDPELRARFEENGRLPVSVIVVTVEEAFLHCGRAVKTAQLWDESRFLKPADLPNTADIFKAHVTYTREKLVVDAPRIET